LKVFQFQFDGDTAGSERLLDELGGEGLRGRQETGATHQHGDVTAQGGHPCGGLTGDDPAADDDETLRDLIPGRDSISLRGAGILKNVLLLLAEFGLPLTYLEHVLSSEEVTRVTSRPMT